MSRRRKHKRNFPDKSIWTKWLFRIVGGLILVILITLIIAKFWLVPAIVHQQVIQGLAEFWDGCIELENVQVNLLGPIYLRAISLSDRTGHEWLHTPVVKLTLANWPGLNPVITEIEIDGLNLHIPSIVSKSILPLRRSHRQATSLNKRFDIRKLTITEAAITVADNYGPKTIYEHLTLLAIRKENFYEVFLNSTDGGVSELLVAKGGINPQDFQLDLSLQMKHTVKTGELTPIFTAIGIPALSAEGKLTAELRITGWLKKPATLQPIGFIKLDDWELAIKDNIIANNLATVAKLNGQRLNLENLTANVYKGRIEGCFDIEIGQNQLIKFSGQIRAQKVSLVEITSALAGPAKKATKGTITLNYNFTAQSGDLKTLKGDGLIFLDDADINIFPIIPDIFTTMELANYDPLTMSDVQVTFAMAGPVATIKNAHIANRFAAIEAEPGGTINIQTGHINMHIIAIPLRQIDTLSKRIPVINIFANLKDKLIRLYIRGHWSDPPAKLITKQPIKDIKEGTIGFIQDVVKSGGQFSQDMIKTLATFLQIRENRNR